MTASPVEPAANDKPHTGAAAVAPGTDPATTAAVRQMFQGILRWSLALLGVILIAGVGIGYLVSGMSGVWGALIGFGLAVFFTALTVVGGLIAADKPVVVLAGVLLAEWFLKAVAIIVVALIIRDRDFYDPVVFFLVLAVAILGSAAIEVREAMRARIPYIVATPKAN